MASIFDAPEEPSSGFKAHYNRQAAIDRLAHRFNLEGHHPRNSMHLAATAIDVLETDGWMSFDKNDVSATNLPEISAGR